MKNDQTDYVNEWTPEEARKTFLDGEAKESYHVETEMARHLNSMAGLEFSNLVIRRLGNNAICIEGNLLVDDESFDIEEYLRVALEVDQVVNRMTVRTSTPVGEETTLEDGETVVDW